MALVIFGCKPNISGKSPLEYARMLAQRRLTSLDTQPAGSLPGYGYETTAAPTSRGAS
jgi:hypothetical protein